MKQGVLYMLKCAAFKTMAILALCLLVLPLSGCGKSDKNTLKENKDFTIKVSELHQLSKLGNINADGQVAVTRLSLLNNTPDDREMRPEEFTLLYEDADEPANNYQQLAEKNMKNDLSKEFGPVAAAKLLNPSGEKLHPHLEAARFLVFMLPNKVNLKNYKLVWAPKKGGALSALSGGGGGDKTPKAPISIKLLGIETQLFDKRS
jgi:hypothetical protein